MIFWTLDIRDNSLKPLFISSIQDKGFAENDEYTDQYENEDMRQHFSFSNIWCKIWLEYSRTHLKWDLNLQMYNQLSGFAEKTLIQQQFWGQNGCCQKSEVADGWGMEKAICYHSNTWNFGLQQQKSLFSCEQETEVTTKVNNRRLGKWSDKCSFLELGLKG